MSYSVSVAVKSPKVKTRMLEFLVDSYRPWPDILDDEGESRFFGPAPIEGLPSHIGFGYEDGMCPEKVYNYSILRWVALRVGRKRRQFKESQFDRPVPYYVLHNHNGSKSFPVVSTGESLFVPSVFKDYIVDEFGLIATNQTARELAWRNIPDGTFERVSVTHAKKSPKEIRDALVRSGIERARIILQFIRAEISRLDLLWES